MAALPYLTPRKAEVQAIAEVLQDPGFDTPEDMAKAILKTAYQQMLRRDWWVAGFPAARSLDRETGERHGHTKPVLFGPYPSDSAAFKAIRSGGPAAGPGGGTPVGIFKVSSIAGAEEFAEASDHTEEDAKCVACRHPRAAHAWPRVNGCAVTNCNCMRFVEGEGK